MHRDDLSDKSQYQTTNVDGASNVATVCSELGIKIILQAPWPFTVSEPGTDENGPVNPFNEYGRTKFEAERKFQTWRAEDDNSLLIVRPTVIFGEGNRGNVFNLLNQIALGKFVMVGDGKNKKSMAYIGNVVAFIEACLATDQKYGIYNYVDTPDLTMNELVSQVRQKLRGENSVGLRLPYWVGMFVGYIADVIAKLSGRNFPISSIRVKKLPFNRI